MSNYAYDRLVDDAIDAALEDDEAMGITDDAQINTLIDQYMKKELERWE